MYDQQPPIKTGLLDFLRKSIGSQFVIPVYQRNYTWTANREVKQYFENKKVQAPIQLLVLFLIIYKIHYYPLKLLYLLFFKYLFSNQLSFFN